MEFENTVSTVKEKAIPVLSWIREAIMKVSEIAAKQFDLVPQNVYNFLIVVLALWIAKKILSFNNDIGGEDNFWKYALVAGGIFYVLKFFGA